MPSLPVTIGSCFIILSIGSAIIKEHVHGKMENEDGNEHGLLNIISEENETKIVDDNYQELNDDEFWILNFIYMYKVQKEFCREKIRDESGTVSPIVFTYILYLEGTHKHLD